MRSADGARPSLGFATTDADGRAKFAHPASEDGSFHVGTFGDPTLDAIAHVRRARPSAHYGEVLWIDDRAYDLPRPTRAPEIRLHPVATTHLECRLDSRDGLRLPTRLWLADAA